MKTMLRLIGCLTAFVITTVVFVTPGHAQLGVLRSAPLLPVIGTEFDTVYSYAFSNLPLKILQKRLADHPRKWVIVPEHELAGIHASLKAQDDRPVSIVTEERAAVFFDALITGTSVEQHTPHLVKGQKRYVIMRKQPRRPQTIAMKE